MCYKRKQVGAYANETTPNARANNSELEEEVAWSTWSGRPWQALVNLAQTQAKKENTRRGNGGGRKRENGARAAASRCQIARGPRAVSFWSNGRSSRGERDFTATAFNHPFWTRNRADDTATSAQGASFFTRSSPGASVAVAPSHLENAGVRKTEPFGMLGRPRRGLYNRTTRCLFLSRIRITQWGLSAGGA